MTDSEMAAGDCRTFDALIVGAGFSGIYMLHRLRNLGFSCLVVEAADDIGGTWYWNRYPGARCDIESMIYSYSFSEELEQEWKWPSRFATQPEIFEYAEHVVERFDLRRDMQFNTRVTDATFDESADRWAIDTDCGERFSVQHLVMATGCLSAPRRPAFEGLDSFEGDWYHTGYWPHEGVDFTGKTVGVIGTGSSAIQSIPIIAAEAEQLTVFQRTPNFSVPAWNVPLTPEVEKRWKDDYAAMRLIARGSGGGDVYFSNPRPMTEYSAQERGEILEERWQDGGFNYLGSFSDFITNAESNSVAAAFVHDKIRQRVDNPAVAELLCPKQHPLGTKRPCVDTDYYETYKRNNVSLVDISGAPIDEITPKGLRIGTTDYAFDALVFATGFDAMTGALTAVHMTGRDGVVLKEKWRGGPRNYLGIAVAGFPNMYTITGPGSPSVLTNMLVSIEQHVDWVVDCMVHLRDHDLATVEPTVDAEDKWVDLVNSSAEATLYPLANSWYMGANIPGKPRAFTPYVGHAGDYRKTCAEVAANGYEGFTLSG